MGVNKRAQPGLITDLYHTLRVPSENWNLCPVQIGTKVNVCEGEGGLKPSVSLSVHVAIPQAATQNQRVKHPATNLTVSAQHAVWNTPAFNYNPGLEWLGNSPIPTYTYTCSFRRAQAYWIISLHLLRCTVL